MKAPEKLFIAIIHPLSNGHTEMIALEHGDGVEYIRKDALIEKACDAYCKVCGHYPHTVPTHICRHDCKYFSDFKKYMED